MDPSQPALKRKRTEPPVLTEEEIAAKIAGKLHHDLKEVRKAAKKAKSFETQKSVKKIKGLRTKTSSKDLMDAEAQLEVLKGINHEHIAHTAIKTKLLKDKRLMENIHVQAAMALELTAENLLEPAAVGTAQAKVQSRLLSSKILASEAAAVLVDLRNVLCPEKKIEAEADASERPKKVKKVDAFKVEKLEISAVSGSESADVDSDDEEDETGWESGTVDEEGGLAPEDGWESGSINGAGVGGTSSSSEEDSDEEDAPKPSTKTKAAKVKPETKKVKPTSESTFLPSLAVGYTRAGSEDSDFSDGEADVAQSEIKKNRRGQRARQAIWEKKYGGGANHVKKNKEKEALAIKSGKPLTRRPPHGSTRGGPPGKQSESQAAQGTDGGWGARQRSNATPATTHAAVSVTTRAPMRAPLPAAPYLPAARAGVPARKAETGLHPSWEAKKKMKEKMSAGIVPSQGTKIKF